MFCRLVAAFACLLGTGAALATAPHHVPLTGSFHPALASDLTPLAPGDSAQPLSVEIALRLRNPAELQTRIDRGEIISHAELAARYLPTAADYEKIADWAQRSGLTADRPSDCTLSFFAHGSVAQLSSAFAMQFARQTATTGIRVASAITEPQLPDDLAPLVLAVNGLQPHLNPPASHPVPTRDLVYSPQAPYSPGQVAAAYNADPSQTGAGQTIAIVIDGLPTMSDLTEFWNVSGLRRTGSTRLIPVGTPLSTPSAEPTIDSDWSTALAPGADLRVYGTPDLALNSTNQALSQIYTDSLTITGLHQLSMSYTYSREKFITLAQVKSADQWFTILTAAGVSCFASSGDAGSQPAYLLNNTVRENDPKQPIDVSFPASSNNVVAVGGTSLTLGVDSSVLTETVWSTGGGGISTLHQRPTWQTVSGLPAGNTRILPDVSAIADPAAGGLIYFNGSETGYGGTSLSSPIWAGVCALANQARATAGLKPLGSFGAAIYPLAGTNAFYDILNGSNGAYTATPGYDLCTGLGTPNIAALVRALTGGSNGSDFPVIFSRAGAVETSAGSRAAFTVEASGSNLTYVWQRLPAGGSSWSEIVDSSLYSGTTTSSLIIPAVSEVMTGDQFRCVVTNSSGTVTSAASTVLVSPQAVVTTLAGVATSTGNSDGNSTSVRFNQPWGVTADANNNLYVADSKNHTIRKITPEGVVSTLAGTAGISGFQNGPLSQALFNLPEGVFADSRGNVYVADSGNHAIRMISPSGTVSTVAGTGAAGYVDGAAATAQFDAPRGIVGDAAGNLYIGDTANNCIRQVQPNGQVTTLAGSPVYGFSDGQGSAAKFNFPRGLAIDSAGNLYVADTGNTAIRKITPDGTATTLAGRGSYEGNADGSGIQPRLTTVYAVALDAAGNVYATEEYTNCIKLITPNGVLSTVAGLPSSLGTADGVGANARFYGPWGITMDHTGTLFVTEGNSNVVRKLILPPQFLSAAGNQTLAVGGSTTLTTSTAGSGLTYQWTFNGRAIAGATQSSLVLSAVTTASAGQYAVIATNAAGSVTSPSATLTVQAAAVPTTRLVNLSTHSAVGLGGSNLSVGFFTAGGPKQLLIRGIGPTLSQFGLSGVLATPELTLFDINSHILDLNDAWGGGTALTGLFNELFAFVLPPGSLDTAFPETLTEGGYSAQISGVNHATGIALAEIFDADASTSTSRLTNLSARAFVGTGANVLVAGFTIAGSGTETVLIRGIGPTLGVFGVPGALPTTQLTLFDQSGATIGSNAGWGGSAQLTQVFQQLSAFGLDPKSADSAILVKLQPGLYTAQLNGLNSDTGSGLIEIYEVPNQ